MATTIITGRDITFTIDSDNFDAQATSATLTVDSTINTYQTLDGKAYFTTDSQGSFAVEMLADWGASGSLCEALWTAAASAPNTALPVVLVAETGASFAFFACKTGPYFRRRDRSDRAATPRQSRCCRRADRALLSKARARSHGRQYRRNGAPARDQSQPRLSRVGAGQGLGCVQTPHWTFDFIDTAQYRPNSYFQRRLHFVAPSRAR